MAIFIANPGDSESIVLPLNGSTVLIGRDRSCDIALKGFGISRTHASITLDPQCPVLRDTESTYGVRVNGAAVRSSNLDNGQIIEIGLFHFNVSLTSENLILKLISAAHGSPAGEFTTSKKVISIGRDPGNEIILSHPLVSRFHAEVHTNENSQMHIRDLKSANGTYVNGRAIKQCVLDDGDVVHIGPFRLFAEHGTLCEKSERKGLHLEAFRLYFRKNRKLILNDISLSIQSGEFVAVLGPSGAGKSSLIRLLRGQEYPDYGSVYYNSLPLKKYRRAFTNQIGYVAQSASLPPELTVDEIFTEQSRIRLPADSGKAGRNARIDEVVNLMELQEARKRRIDELSGGELRRVHLGVELLASPPMVFLDEPLAGLDPGLNERLMHLFRRVCDKGHTLVMVTHIQDHLHLCDRIIFIKNGLCTYIGSQASVKDITGCETVSQLYTLDTTDLSTKHTDRPDHFSYIEFAGMQNEKKKIFNTEQGNKVRFVNFFSHSQLLFIRYLKILTRDKKNFFLIFSQTPFLALLLGWVFSAGTTATFSLSFYFCIMIASVWIGGVNSIKEIARDWDILIREHRAGLTLSAFVSAKTALFSAVALIQGVMFSVCVDLIFSKFHATPEFYLIVATATISGSLLGLTISAFAGTVARAITLLPLAFIPQIFFSGILLPFDQMSIVGRVASHCTLSRPIFGLLKEVCILNRKIFSSSNWGKLLLVDGVLFILMLLFVAGQTLYKREK